MRRAFAVRALHRDLVALIDLRERSGPRRPVQPGRGRRHELADLADGELADEGQLAFGVDSSLEETSQPGVKVLGLAACCADRDGDADQRNDRTNDGPGGGVAHRATADDAEALQSPQQSEQGHDHTNHDEGNAHESTVGLTALVAAVLSGHHGGVSTTSERPAPDYPQMAAVRGRVEPAPRRVRGFLGHELVFDTTSARYVWEVPYYPQYYIPRSGRPSRVPA